ncbi:MAG: type VI secretion IcmF C-terminal domain-containing protein [Gammaproteobacteria bacterium]
MPNVRFQLRPLSLASNASRFVLDLDGQVIAYDNTPAPPTAVQWPGPGGVGRVQLQFFPALGEDKPAQLEVSGPWAWFRVLDKSNLSSTGQPEVFNVTFNAGGFSATYELRANSAFNPFQLDLESFQCLQSL